MYSFSVILVNLFKVLDTLFENGFLFKDIKEKKDEEWKRTTKKGKYVFKKLYGALASGGFVLYHTT